MSVYPSAEVVIDALTTIVGDDDDDEEEHVSPQAEIENTQLRVTPINSPTELINRFITLVETVHQSLVPCLVATPFVYLSENDWALSSHADFRAEKRKQLKDIEAVLKLRGVGIENSELLSLIEKFEGILMEIFKVRIPAMPSYYVTENFYDTVDASEVAVELSKIITDARIFDAKTRLQGLTKLLVRWFLLCPIGRPLVHVSDEGWTTTSEKDLRASYREKLIASV